MSEYSLVYLKSQATKNANNFGHLIKWDTPVTNTSYTTQLGSCVHCKAHIALHTNPTENNTVGINGYYAFACQK